ncbi:MAG: agmatine deiminase family protein [Spirochaetota bacterium]
MRSNDIKLIPDWKKPSRVFLAYPKAIRHSYTFRGKRRVDDYDKLVPFYDQLIIRHIPFWIPATILFRAKDDFALLAAQYGNDDHNITAAIQPSLCYPWLRDYAGFAVRENGRKKIMKPMFAPSYLPAGFALTCEKIGRDIVPGTRCETIPLVWDGGNLVHNGEGVAIIDEYMFKRNSRDIKTTEGRVLKKTRAEIIEMLQKKLGITHPIFIPSKRGDWLHHADGYFAFLDARTVAVEMPPPVQVKKALAKLDIKIVTLASCLPKHSKQYPDSIEGSYINFLRLGDIILMPRFGAERECFMKNIRILGKYAEVEPVDDAEELARFGGLLHCISHVI